MIAFNARNSPKKVGFVTYISQVKKLRETSGLGKVTQIWELVHRCPHPMLWAHRRGWYLETVDKGAEGFRHIPGRDDCKSWVGQALSPCFQNPNGVRTLPFSYPLLCPYCCWLSSEPPLQPSSASFILSSPLHAERKSRGLGRRWPAILHAVGHNVPIVLSRGRCPGPGER